MVRAGLMATLLCGVVSCGSAASEAGGGPASSGCHDLDGDGFEAEECGGLDCDDSNPARGGPDTNGVLEEWAATLAVTWLPPYQLGDTRDPLDLALDDSGAVHLLVAGTYASNRSGEWRMESITGSKAYWPSTPALAVAEGIVHASFVDDSGTSYARREGGLWTHHLVDGAKPYASSMGLDAASQPWVAYTSSAGLRLARLENGGWVIVQLAPLQPTESMPSVAFAFDGASRAQIVLATCRETDCEVAHGPVMNDAWQPEVVRRATYVTRVALAVDDLDQPHVAFNSGVVDSSSLFYARRKLGAWEVSPVDVGGWARDFDLAVSGSTVRFVVQTGGVSYLSLEDGAQIPDPRSTNPTTGSGCDCWGGTAIAAGRDGSNHIAFTGFNYAIGTHVNYSTDQTIAPDGIDDNCDGVDGIDSDRDGIASVPSGGIDCDDADAHVFPGNGCP